MAQQENEHSSFPFEITPLDSDIFHRRNISSSSSLCHLNQRQALSQNYTAQNPHYYNDSIESLFSRLDVSQYVGQGFNGGDDAFVGSVLDRPFVGNQAFQDQYYMGQNLFKNNGVNSYVSAGLHDYGFSNTDIWDNFSSDSVLQPNINRVFGGDSGIPFSNGLVSKTTQDHSIPGLYNRKPYWLQQEPFSNNNYKSPSMEYYLRSGSGSNMECAVPLPLEYLMGRIVRLAKDQNGCRLVQMALNNVTHEELDMVLLEVIDSIGELMAHPFGNYVVQKLIEVSSEEQRTRMLVAVTKTGRQLVKICLNMHGSRAVQKLLEGIASNQVSFISRQQVNIFMSALSPGAVDLAKDTNGHHVIKYCLDHFLPEDNKYLLNVVADKCYDIATDKSGCCVLQHCVDLSTGEPRDRLVANITQFALHLSQDKYGNYVVQHLLGLGIPRITANLVSQLGGYFAALARNKYGSNVVEKCLVESGEKQSTQIILELLSSSSFSLLLVDPFGNFVIQSALKVSKMEGSLISAFLKLILPNIPAMRSNIYGKKVLAWLHKEGLLSM